MNRAKGFTLVEVLVSMIVLSIGLLGLAGLQATSLRNNQSAYYRSQATFLAYDIADRMRANPESSDEYLIDAGGDGGGGDDGGDDGGDSEPRSNDQEEGESQVSACYTTAGCSPEDLANLDITEWQESIANNLPSGEATVTANGSKFSVTINWDDNRDGEVNNDDPQFRMEFQL